MKKICVLGLGILMFSACVNAQTATRYIRDNDKTKTSEYDYVYMNPPKPSLYVAGRYLVSKSGVRYVHSPSKHKRASAAARINAYNYEYGNY